MLAAGFFEWAVFWNVVAIALVADTAKMLLAEAIEVPLAVSLAVIAGLLTVSVAASRFFPVRASDIQEKNRI